MISGNITGIQKAIFPSKTLPFITVMEHHVLQTGAAGASCRTVFFMNSFINIVNTLKGINNGIAVRDYKIILYSDESIRNFFKIKI